MAPKPQHKGIATNPIKGGKKPTQPKLKNPVDADAYDSDDADEKMVNIEDSDNEQPIGKIDAPKQVDEEEQYEEVDEEDSIGDDLEVDDEDKDLEDHESEEEIEHHDAGEEAADDGDAAYDECLYEGSDDEVDDDDDVVDQESSTFVPNDQRRTKRILYRYEYVRCLRDRVEQLIQKAKPMIKDADSLTPVQVAKLEIKLGSLPFSIIRTMPNGQREKWMIEELDRSHLDIDV